MAKGNGIKNSKVGFWFYKEIEEIKDKRLLNGIDKERRSTKQLTNLITEHPFWKDIKKETIEVKGGKIEETLKLSGKE